MSSVIAFRKACRHGQIASFVSNDTSLPATSMQNIFFKLINSIRRNKRNNIQITIGQIKWYESKFHSLDILDYIFKNKTMLTKDDYHAIFESYMEILENNPERYGGYFKHLPEFAQIMNEEIFRRLHEYFNMMLSLKIQEYDAELWDWTALSLVDEVYINPMCKLIEQIRKNSKSKEDAEFTAKEAFDIIGDDAYMYAKYIQFDASSQLHALFSENPKVEHTPEGLYKMYRKLAETNTLTDMKKLEYGRESPAKWDAYGVYRFLREDFFPQISWSADEYKKFLDLFPKEERLGNRDFVLIFKLINSRKDAVRDQPEILQIFNNFIEKYKMEYIRWLMAGQEEYLSSVYTRNDIAVCVEIIEELIKRQEKEKLSFLDIINCGGGISSRVYSIGDYVVKIGGKRLSPKIANHRRVLQPIIRRQNENMFIEVADNVDTKHISQEDVERVFYEMLEDGYGWLDPKYENLGRLRRQNVPRNGIQRAVRTEDGIQYVDDESGSSPIATNMKGSIDGEPLGEGELVIVDTDLIVNLRNPQAHISFQKYMTQEMREALIKKREEFFPQEHQEEETDKEK